MRYLLDSDIVIDYLRNYRPTIDKLDNLLKQDDDLFISAITNLELHAGESITQTETLNKINDLFSRLSTVEVNLEIAGLAGDFRRTYKTAIPDALIAACAFSIEAALVTKNIKHFQTIKEIKIKKL